MNVTRPILEKIVQLEEQYNIKNNELMNFYLFCLTKKSTTYSFLIELYDLSDINLYEELLINNNMINIADIPKKQKNKVDKNKEVEEDIAMQTIEHLESVVGRKIRITNFRIKLILRWIKSGYRLKDFMRVNLYFNMKWREDPEMNKYIRIETLYNSKFITRIEEANSLFNDIESNKEYLSLIIGTYSDEYFKKFGKIPDKSSLKSLKTLDQLNFWVSHYRVEELISAIKLCFFKYINSEISLLKILKNDFVRKINESKNLQISATERFTIGG